MGKKKRRQGGLRSCLAVLRTRFILLRLSVLRLLLLLSLTPELTVSILRLLCSHLILIPGLLRSRGRGVAVAVYFNRNPFTIGDRCCRARARGAVRAADVTCGDIGKAWCVKTGPMRRKAAVAGVRGGRRWMGCEKRRRRRGTNLQFEFIKLNGHRDFY